MQTLGTIGDEPSAPLKLRIALKDGEWRAAALSRPALSCWSDAEVAVLLAKTGPEPSIDLRPLR